MPQYKRYGINTPLEHEQAKAAVKIISNLIRASTPQQGWGRSKDAAGERIYAHYDDGNQKAPGDKRPAATVNYAGTHWCSYVLLDVINEALAACCLPFIAEYYSEYELTLENE